MVFWYFGTSIFHSISWCFELRISVRILEAFLVDMDNNVGILVGAYFVFLYSVIWHYTCNYIAFFFLLCILRSIVVFGLF